MAEHHSYLCEVYPTDYTEFESDSEIEDQARSVAPYDTVQDTDVDDKGEQNELPRFLI